MSVVRNLLYCRKYPINEYVSVEIPTVGDILDHEDEYYGMVSLITATPYDMMVQLDDMGVDFTQINDYELFLLMFGFLKTQDTSMILGELDLNGFDTALNPQNGNVILRNEETGAVIDREIHAQICNALRKIHHMEKNIRKPANAEAKAYMIQRAREKMKRKRRPTDSQLEELIVALVNTEQFHYGFDGTRELSIYQFNESVHQVIKKIDFDNRMHGIYAGTISAKDMSQDDLNWLTHK